MKRNSLVTKLFYTVCVGILMWIFISTAEVMIHNDNESYNYSRYNFFVNILEGARETKVMVVECVPVDNYYEITVEDADGNLWAYYDDSAREIGTVLDKSYCKGEN